MDIRIVLRWVILATIPFLLGNHPETKFSGNFSTEDIRISWLMCSSAYQKLNIAPSKYYPMCDCAVDVMRKNYDNVTVFETMIQAESNKLAVLIRLQCNEWKIDGAGGKLQ